MVFSILFGLSCDYQVFLVSRMHEEWVNTGDNRKAIRRGLAGSGRVVAIAAAIMTSVFGAFILGNDAIIKLFGVALSTAVLLDAFVVRLILVPSLMTIFGRANWWLPGWLSRLLHITESKDTPPRAPGSGGTPPPPGETDPPPVYHPPPPPRGAMTSGRSRRRCCRAPERRPAVPPGSVSSDLPPSRRAPRSRPRAVRPGRRG